MTEPLIFIFTVAIKEGRLEDYKAYLPRLVEFIDANEPDSLWRTSLQGWARGQLQGRD
jgi:hypothetical protein